MTVEMNHCHNKIFKKNLYSRIFPIPPYGSGCNVGFSYNKRKKPTVVISMKMRRTCFHERSLKNLMWVSTRRDTGIITRWPSKLRIFLPSCIQYNNKSVDFFYFNRPVKWSWLHVGWSIECKHNEC